MSSSTEANTASNKRRRRRPAKSCEQCRRRKIRCDQDHPCRACVRARAPLQCEYRDTGDIEAPAPSKKARTLALNETDLRTRAAVEDRRRSVDQDLVLRFPKSPSQHRTPPAQENRPASEREHQSTHTYNTATPTSSTSSSSIPPVVPRLRNVPEKTKLFGQTHWLHAAEKVPISGRFHPVEIEPSLNGAKAELVDSLKEIRTLRFSIKGHYSVNFKEPIKDLFSTLPSKATCDDLVQCYIRTLEPLYRILYLPCFWKEYNRLWEIPTTPNASTMFLTKLSLILSLGTTFHTAIDQAESEDLRRLAQTWLQNAQWWLTGPSEKTTFNLDGLQIFCLLVLARQTTFNCPGAASWLSTGSLLRMAITMGLHRTSTTFPTLSVFQQQYRSRLWATVLELSVQSCLDLALPLHMSPNDYDTELPLNYNDADLESGSKNGPAPSTTFTDSSLQILLARSLPLRIEVVRLLNDFRVEQSYDRALKIGAEIRSACREIAAFFNSHKASTGESWGNSTLRPAEFHRKLMDIHLRRFNLFLYRDFMLHALIDPKFYLARKLCVESAVVIVSASKGSDLGLPTQELDDFAKLSAVARGLFKCALSLDALIILALEIIVELDEETVPQEESDALDDLTRTHREFLIQTLEDANGQLKHLLALGTTSLKRMLFIGTYLSQIRAMQTGRPVMTAIFEAVAEAARECLVVLREKHAALTHQEPLGTSEMLTSDFSSFDFAPGDMTMGWDFSDLLNFPTLSENGQGRWPT